MGGNQLGVHYYTYSHLRFRGRNKEKIERLCLTVVKMFYFLPILFSSGGDRPRTQEYPIILASVF